VFAFNISTHYGAGPNLYQYLGANPLGSLDPMGTDMIDDEHIFTGVQNAGLQTTQIAAASGQLYYGAYVYTNLLNKFLAITGGTGRGWVEKMDDCVRKYDPASLVLGGLGEGLARVGSLVAFPYGKKMLGNRVGYQNQRLTTIASTIAQELEREGAISQATKKAIRGAGRAASWVAVGYNVMLFAVEVSCGISVGLGHDPGQ